MRFIDYFKVLLPSWRFFDQLGHIPKLYVRTAHASRDEAESAGSDSVESINWSEWQEFAKPKRNLISLFYNPDGNIFLLGNTILIRLMNDPYDAVALEMLERWVLYLVQTQYMKSSDAIRYQFKISIVGKDVSSAEDLLISSDYFYMNSVYEG